MTSGGAFNYPSISSPVSLRLVAHHKYDVSLAGLVLSHFQPKSGGRLGFFRRTAEFVPRCAANEACLTVIFATYRLIAAPPKNSPHQSAFKEARNRAGAIACVEKGTRCDGICALYIMGFEAVQIGCGSAACRTFADAAAGCLCSSDRC